MTKAPPNLVGPVNETVVKVNNIPALGLLDTGSQISCVSQSFYEQHLSHIEIQSLDSLLQIEGVGGNLLPYTGFIEVEVTFPARVLGDEKTLACLLLVTSDTRYNAKCPILLGTNVISSCLQFHNDFKEENQLPMAWKVAFQCICMDSAKVEEVFEVKTETQVKVEANASCLIDCSSNDKVEWKTPYMLVEGDELTSLPGGLFITPLVVSRQISEKKFPVLVTNFSQKAVIIPSKATVGNVVPLTIALILQHNKTIYINNFYKI